MMSKHHDRSTYEPFGERLDTKQVIRLPASRAPIRRVGITLFWTVAILLLGARIYLAETPEITTGAGTRASAPHDFVVR